MYRARRALVEKDSVSPAIIQRTTKKYLGTSQRGSKSVEIGAASYQYQVEKQCFKNLHEIGVRSETSGTREIAKAFSSAER